MMEAEEGEGVRMNGAENRRKRSRRTEHRAAPQETRGKQRHSGAWGFTRRPPPPESSLLTARTEPPSPRPNSRAEPRTPKTPRGRGAEPGSVQADEERVRAGQGGVGAGGGSDGRTGTGTGVRLLLSPPTHINKGPYHVTTGGHSHRERDNQTPLRALPLRFHFRPSETRTHELRVLPGSDVPMTSQPCSDWPVDFLTEMIQIYRVVASELVEDGVLRHRHRRCHRFIRSKGILRLQLPDELTSSRNRTNTSPARAPVGSGRQRFGSGGGGGGGGFGRVVLWMHLLQVRRCAAVAPLGDFRVECEEFCQGTSNHLTLLVTRDHHYDNMMRMYSNCSVVLENLEVTYYTKENHDLSFLRSIQEVGGYVLIAMNDAATVPLVNLRLIRGHALYEGQYALLVMSNYHRNSSSASLDYSSGLRSLQLSNLTEILKGGVKVTHNPLLCNIETIQWWDILDKTTVPSVVVKLENYPRQCESCDRGCVNGSCWASGPDHCQKFTKLQCADQCSRRCRGPKPIDCCNEHCAAGCTGPKATDCLACRLFNDDGTCKDACPPPFHYDVNTHQVVSNPNAKFTFGATCVKACPHNYVVTDGSCVRTCSIGKYEVMENGVQRCKDCDGPCPKACDGVGVGALVKTIAVNASNIESFRNCTKINGDVSLIETSFTGDRHYGIPAMDPSKLEYFRTLKEITGFLLIQYWPENMTSLSVFENLEIIRGRTTRSGHSVVVVGASHLRWLGPAFSAGGECWEGSSEEQRPLCFTQPDKWRRLFKTRSDRLLKDNAPPARCREYRPLCLTTPTWFIGTTSTQ
ncbi:melanoma receptor tyrosine-protein kinase-like [Sphaeramia orbicularis]|uniref:melanoma receptor tyrosine-protein kinase-like n=1 Tax=Sphaeramia orbicularis TaxID=375764 RepID=UPI00117E0A37|nr:melanoma receptor tyrosine-protein kinase-like [Sphaeramia orbicularis]